MGLRRWPGDSRDGRAHRGGLIFPRRVALTLSEDHAQNQDYSKNKNYQVGMRDGKDDKAHNRDHSRKRNFKKDEDQRAYESGYQQTHHGDQK
jgi:hypothetical protein